MKFRELLEGNVLSRVFMSASDSNKCMAIFTASRSENSEAQNGKDNAEIRAELKRLKVGYRIAKGHWPELIDGEKVNHIDDSTIVIMPSDEEEFLEKFSINICRKYNQDGVFFKKSNGEVGIFDKNGNFEKIGNEFHPDKVSDYMTEIKGKSFVFEDISDYVPQGIISFVDAQKAHYLRKSLKWNSRKIWNTNFFVKGSLIQNSSAKEFLNAFRQFKNFRNF